LAQSCWNFTAGLFLFYLQLNLLSTAFPRFLFRFLFNVSWVFDWHILHITDHKKLPQQHSVPNRVPRNLGVPGDFQGFRI
jgi:hypothetical protein